MKFEVKYKTRAAELYAPKEDFILKHWRRGRFYEAQPGQLLDLMHGIDIGTYVDVGAHWGNHAAFIAQQAKSLHLIELRPDSFKVLKRNTERWKDKCSYYNIALGAQDTWVDYEQLTPGNIGTTQVRPSDTGVRGAVKMVELDSLKLRPDFIKIDVEGHEFAVLFGGMYTIRKYRPWIACELTENEDDIHTFMKHMNYEPIETKNATKTTLFKPRLLPVG